MLSSIHPLGERARHNRWAVTVIAFTLGAVVGGAAVGAALGGVGSLAVADWSETTRLTVTGLVALGAGLVDLGVRPPGPQRQVNEHWIGRFRGWVYGGSFGLELGVGVATYVVTWLVYATFAAAVLTADWRSGLLVGGVFGLGRSLGVLAAGWIDRPSRLTAFHRAMASLGPPVRRTAPVLASVAGAVAVWGGLT